MQELLFSKVHMLTMIVLPPIEKFELRDYEKAFNSHAFKVGFVFE